ncbi:hypothetical protein EQG41_18070 [Billgrantia azerbaijanica]|nr:hypothetical protein EQG41_18070 [Halomonas azerbaijanica]
MTAHAKAPTTDEINEMLCTRNDQLEAEKAALAEQIDAAERDNDRLRSAAQRARLIIGDSITGPTGLQVVDILERALKEGA